MNLWRNQMTHLISCHGVWQGYGNGGAMMECGVELDAPMMGFYDGFGNCKS